MSGYQFGHCSIESSLDHLLLNVVQELKDELRGIKAKLFHYYMRSFDYRTSSDDPIRINTNQMTSGYEDCEDNLL